MRLQSKRANVDDNWSQALSVKMGVNFMLFYMTLRTLGTDKHQPLVHDTMRRSCKSLSI